MKQAAGTKGPKANKETRAGDQDTGETKSQMKLTGSSERNMKLRTAHPGTGKQSQQGGNLILNPKQRGNYTQFLPRRLVHEPGKDETDQPH